MPTEDVFAHLDNTGISAWVVNAHRIKHVPGRKTDMADSEWLRTWLAAALGAHLQRQRG